MFIFTFLSIFLILSRGKIRRDNDGYSASGYDWNQFLSVLREMELFPNSSTCWIGQLQIEHCDFTKIVYYNISARKHRGLCGISLPSIETFVWNGCAATSTLQLHRTKELSAYFQTILPKSICPLFNVSQVDKYFIRAINGICFIKCPNNCHKILLFGEEAQLWMSTITVIAFGWPQSLSSICQDICEEELVMVVPSRYNQVTKSKIVSRLGTWFCCPKNLMKCFYKVSTINDFMTTMQSTELLFFIIDLTQNDTTAYALVQLNNKRQKIDEVYCENDYKEEIKLVTPQDWKSVRYMRRRLLQNTGHEYYGNADYNAQGHQYNYRGYQGFDVREDDDTDDNDDDDDEEYDISDEKVDDHDDEDEENEPGEDDEFGHQGLGQRIRMARSNRIVQPYKNEKPKEYLTKENLKIRSITEECNEEPTEELQYYDYETSGIDTTFGNIHKLQIGYLTRLTIMNLLLIFII